MNEEEVRKLRDRIFGPCSQGNWDGCKKLWMLPKNLEWLIEFQPEEKDKPNENSSRPK